MTTNAKISGIILSELFQWVLVRSTCWHNHNNWAKMVKTKTFSPRLTSFCRHENCEFKRFKNKFVNAIMAVRPSIRLLKLKNSHCNLELIYIFSLVKLLC